METKKLAHALSMVGRFVHPRSPLDRFRMVWVRRLSGGSLLSASTTTGSVEVFLEEDCGVDVCVQHSILSGLVKSLRQDEVEMSHASNTLNLHTPNGELNIPTHELPPPHIEICEESQVYVVSKDVSQCSKRLRGLSDTSELRYSQSQRVYTDGDFLRVVCSNHRAWGCSWIEFEGDDMDVMVPNASMMAAMECLPGETSSLAETDSGLSVVSDNVTMFLPTEVNGATHRPYSNASKAWESANIWLVDREDILEFLSQVKVFSTPHSTGVWLQPTSDGLLCKYTGRSDGTHSPDLSVSGFCDYLAEGSCDGDKMYISSVLLSTAIECASDKNFCMHATHQGLFVTSDGFAWGIGAMEPPSEDKK